MQIQGFQGMWFEIEFAICIVKIATKLESMVIDPHGSFYDGDGTWYNITCSYEEGNEDEHPEEVIEGISKDENVDDNVPYELLCWQKRGSAAVQERLKDAEQEEYIQSLPAESIKITLWYGQVKEVKEGKKWITSPLDISEEVSESFASKALVAELGCKLCIGPCTTKQEGFYYDAYYGGLGLNDEHLKKIEALAKKAVEAKHCFERIEVSVEQALEIFSDNKFKVEIINELHADNKAITVYRCGDLVDLCPGPHIPNTFLCQGIRCLKASSAYWSGKKT
ncbi:hypothetical protein ACLB2K_061878 [Fragaria x ananassa]